MGHFDALLLESQSMTLEIEPLHEDGAQCKVQISNASVQSIGIMHFYLSTCTSAIRVAQVVLVYGRTFTDELPTTPL